MSRAACLAAGLLLAGCALEEPAQPTIVAPGGDFARPVGTSRNTRVGSIGRSPSPTGPQLLQLTRTAAELSLKKEELVVSRNRALQPTALLRIVEIRGMAALAVILRGQPVPDDEVVLPSSPLRQQAEALPPARPGS